MNYIKLIFTALIFIAIFVVIFQNQEAFVHEYRLEFDLWIYQLPAYYVKSYALMLFAFGFGVVLSIFMGIYNSSGKRAKIKSSNKRIKELEKEISDIRMARTPSAPSAPGVGQSEKSSGSPFITPGD